MKILTPSRIDTIMKDIQKKSVSEASKFIRTLQLSQICSTQKNILISACELKIPNFNSEDAIVVSSGFE